MLDPDEMAAYEAWKQHKLTTATDLSVSTFNVEQEAGALAWEAGVRAAFAGAIARKSSDEIIAANPYRAPGMTGFQKPKPTTTSSTPTKKAVS